MRPEDEIQRLRTEIIRRGWWREPPCAVCGYNGPGYYQPATHPCAEQNRDLLREVLEPVVERLMEKERIARVRKGYET